jgi:HlyD family secretion protein
MTAVDSARGDGWRGEDRPDNRMRRRRIILGVLLLLVIALIVATVLLALAVQSPAQQAAQTRAPALTQLTAPVQKTVLATTVLAQGVVTAPREVSPATIGSTAGASPGQDVQQIVTRIFKHAGHEVSQGQPILEVAGRPFYLLEGKVPAYRNLEPGESGPDVTQLQDDLQTLGYGIGADTPGVYGAGTAAAVADFYASLGYTAPAVTTGPKADRGAMVPLGEYSFVPRLPARIASLNAKVGQPPKPGGLTLAVGDPVITGQLSPSDTRLVRPGQPVTITEPGTGAVVPGLVTSISRAAASSASISGGLYVAMGIRPSRPLPLSLVGQDVSITIDAAHSVGPVLAVPEAAVFAGADGQTYVSRLSGRRLLRVPVHVGMSGSGLVQVTPLGPTSLSAGDPVVTGENYASGSTPRSAVSRAGDADGTGPGGRAATPVGSGG